MKRKKGGKKSTIQKRAKKKKKKRKKSQREKERKKKKNRTGRRRTISRAIPFFCFFFFVSFIINDTNGFVRGAWLFHFLLRLAFSSFVCFSQCHSSHSSFIIHHHSSFFFIIHTFFLLVLPVLLALSPDLSFPSAGLFLLLLFFIVYFSSWLSQVFLARSLLFFLCFSFSGGCKLVEIRTFLTFRIRSRGKIVLGSMLPWCTLAPRPCVCVCVRTCVCCVCVCARAVFLRSTRTTSTSNRVSWSFFPRFLQTIKSTKNVGKGAGMGR